MKRTNLHYLLLLSFALFLNYSCKKETNTINTQVETPIAIAASDINYNYFSANFQSIHTYDSFKLYVALDSSFSMPTIYVYDNASLSGYASNLLPGTTYFYKVKTFLNGQESIFSNIIKTKTKDWDGQVSYNGVNENVITKRGYQGLDTYTDLLLGVTTNTNIYTGNLFFTNIAYQTSATAFADGSSILNNGKTLTAKFYINNKVYNSKAGGQLNLSGATGFSFNCQFYLVGDPNKNTVYTITGNSK